MAASLSTPSITFLGSTTRFRKPAENLTCLKGSTRLVTRVAPMETLPAGAEPVTWQIIVGSVAGVTPFVVAGIEFSKRIIAQKGCKSCSGSGLVLRDRDYVKCPECGGFLPWQSWKRFFTG